MQKMQSIAFSIILVIFHSLNIRKFFNTDYDHQNYCTDKISNGNEESSHNSKIKDLKCDLPCRWIFVHSNYANSNYANWLSKIKLTVDSHSFSQFLF